MLPPFLKCERLWDNEMAWAYSIGQFLGGAKNTVIHTRAQNGKIYLEVSPQDLSLFLTKLGCSVWKEGRESHNIGDEVLPHLFNMDLFYSSTGNELAAPMPMTLMKFRSLFAKYSLHPATMLIADMAILMWLVDEIHVKPDNLVVDVDPSVLEAVCALSMYSEIEKHCTTDIIKVLAEAQILIHHDPTNDYFFSLVNIIKLLEPSEVRGNVEKIAFAKFLNSYTFANKKIFLMCKILLGAEHDFVKAIEMNVPEEDLASINSLYSSFANNIEIYSLCNVFDLKMNLGDFCLSVKDCIVYMSAEVEKVAPEGEFQRKPLKWHPTYEKPLISDNTSFINSFVWDTDFMFIISRIPLPARILHEIRMCTDWNQLQYLRRISLIYGVTILKTNFPETIWMA